MKILLLVAYISVHWFDVICISETFLESCTVLGDQNLEMKGHNLVRLDHPSNSKYGEVCIYYKQSLALRITNVEYLQEWIVFKVLIGDKLYNFISLYWSPSQSIYIFEIF